MPENVSCCRYNKASASGKLKGKALDRLHGRKALLVTGWWSRHWSTLQWLPDLCPLVV
jgi:hypothetical protein